MVVEFQDTSFGLEIIQQSSVMKVFILFVLFAASQANVLIEPGLYGVGAAAQQRSQDNLGNYASSDKEALEIDGDTFRKETASDGVVDKPTGLSFADGRMRIANYAADAVDFRADIMSSDPGVEPEDSDMTVAESRSRHHSQRRHHHRSKCQRFVGGIIIYFPC